jgi:predicted nucleic-acid-binding Zn-ribbon protein
MPQMNVCSKCHSHKIMQNLAIRLSTMESPHVVVFENPDAWVFKDSHYGPLSACVCGECGYTELYVENPQELFSVYAKEKT